MMRRIWQWLRPRSNEDFASEVESHLAMEVDRLVASGMPEAEARVVARRAFGNPTSVREQFHDTRWPMLESLAQDVRYGLRGMRRNPGFTAIAVISLAIGIGANTTMFGTLDALLLRGPARVVDADRIHRLYFVVPRPGEVAVPAPNQGFRTYAALRENAHSFESVAAFWTSKVTSGRGADARSIDFVAATSNFLPMLGVRPAIGRFFADDEERDENNHVAVLGADFWRSAYGGDRNVLGKTIDVRGTPYTIIGVAPDGFTGVNLSRVDLWLPLGIARTLLAPNVMERKTGSFWLQIVGKSRAGTSRAQLATEATTAFREEWSDSPRYKERFANARALIGPVQQGRGPSADLASRMSIWIAAVSLLVLLLASANVANLLLLRSLSRAREVAVRVSLGASRGRLVQQWLVEGGLLATTAVICALAVARWSAASVHTFLLPDALPASLLNPRLLGFTMLVGLGAGLVASLIPAVVIAHRDSARTLGTSRMSGGPQRVGLQRFLIGAQVALAMMLLVGAGLFVTSFRQIRAIDLGIDVDHVLFVNVDFGSMRKLSSDQRASSDANALYRQMLEQIRRVPGVAHASMSAGSSFGPSSAAAMFRSGTTPVQGPPTLLRPVSTDFFETIGTALVRGRLFTSEDHRLNSHVAIVDESAAKLYLPGGNGLESCVVVGRDQCTRIVGIVKDAVRWEMLGEKGNVAYVPLESREDVETVTTISVRATGDPVALIPAVRRAVQSVSPELPWVDVHPVSQDLDPELRPRRMSAAMFTTFGILALGLAAVGLYGLLAYAVTQRSHEIGVRKALGAADSGIVRMVLRGALGVTLVGVAVGLVASLAASKVLASQLYGVSPRDPLILSISAASLIVVTIIAALAPVRRATRVDPVVTLRAD
jgi:predicted permease